MDMMLTPTPESLNPANYNPLQLGSCVIKGDVNDVQALETPQLALIGLDEQVGNDIRKELFVYAWGNNGSQIVDLGNMENRDAESVKALFSKIKASHLVPVFLGGQCDNLKSILLALSAQIPIIQWAAVDKKKRSLNPTDEEKAKLARLQNHWMGTQKHIFQEMTNGEAEWVASDIGLGELRYDLKEMEPVIRECVGVSVNLTAVRSSEAPASSEAGPSGMYSEEACQIGRYAGLSDHCNTFWVHGIESELDTRGLSVACAAQLIWYFAEAFTQRKNDHPIVNKHMTSYTVSMKNPDMEITFLKSQKSGRWWLDLSHSSEDQQRYLACSHRDYLMACQNMLPDRFVNALTTHPVHSL